MNEQDINDYAKLYLALCPIVDIDPVSALCLVPRLTQAMENMLCVKRRTSVMIHIDTMTQFDAIHNKAMEIMNHE